MPTKEYPGGSRISCEEANPDWETVQVGPDVIIECRRFSFGHNVRIGTLESEESFRYPGGVRIRVNDLILGDNVQIGRHTLIRGGRIELDHRVRLLPDVTIYVTRQLVIGSDGAVHEQGEISGVDIVIGRRLWMLAQAKIGGGSAFEGHSRLRIGHWAHLGVRSLLNTARPITIGDEVGLGTATCLYTHGAYASALDGKPVAFGPISIGDRTWIPGAIVNPSVSIGRDCVIGVGSLVTRDIPDGSFAAGIPAKVLKENAYPQPLAGLKRFAFFLDFMRTFSEICSDRWNVNLTSDDTMITAIIGQTLVVYCPEFVSQQMRRWEASAQVVVLTDNPALDTRKLPTHFTTIDFAVKRLSGPATPLTERLLNQFRRYGVRFNYEAEDGHYVPWH